MIGKSQKTSQQSSATLETAATASPSATTKDHKMEAVTADGANTEVLSDEKGLHREI